MASQTHKTWEIFTARKRSLRRLCFYSCLSVHRGRHAWLWGAGGHMWLLVRGVHGCRGCVVAGGGMCGGGGGHAWLQGGMYGCGGHAWLRGTYMVVGGMCGCQGVCVVAGGAWMVVGGVHGCRGGAWHTTRYGQ